MSITVYTKKQVPEYYEDYPWIGYHVVFDGKEEKDNMALSDWCRDNFLGKFMFFPAPNKWMSPSVSVEKVEDMTLILVRWVNPLAVEK